MSGGRLKNRAEERTQMLQQLSHVRNGQAKKDEGLQVETKAKQYIYIYVFMLCIRTTILLRDRILYQLA